MAKTGTADPFTVIGLPTLAVVTREERDVCGPPGRSCFVQWPTLTAAKAAITDLLLAGLEFTVAGLFAMDDGTAEVWFGLHTLNHDNYLTPAGDAMEAAWRAYAESFGGIYTGS